VVPLKTLIGQRIRIAQAASSWMDPNVPDYMEAVRSTLCTPSKTELETEPEPETEPEAQPVFRLQLQLNLTEQQAEANLRNMSSYQRRHCSGFPGWGQMSWNERLAVALDPTLSRDGAAMAVAGARTAAGIRQKKKRFVGKKLRSAAPEAVPVGAIARVTKISESLHMRIKPSICTPSKWTAHKTGQSAFCHFSLRISRAKLVLTRTHTGPPQREN